MDYQVFEGKNGHIIYYGLIQNVKSIQEAHRKLKRPELRGRTFYLVKTEHFARVVV